MTGSGGDGYHADLGSKVEVHRIGLNRSA